MISILDYGLGNLFSIKKAVELYTEVEVTSELGDVDGIILPGVGAFRDGISKLEPLKEQLVEKVKSGTPILGICLGMQILLSSSEEGGKYEGLDLIPGKVVKLPLTVKVPQIGWNSVKIEKPGKLLAGIPDNSYFYFVNSYYCKPDKGVAATTNYGTDFCSVLEYKNIFATQFHPEKSGEAGLQIIKNFLEACKK